MESANEKALFEVADIQRSCKAKAEPLYAKDMVAAGEFLHTSVPDHITISKPFNHSLMGGACSALQNLSGV